MSPTGGWIGACVAARNKAERSAWRPVWPMQRRGVGSRVRVLPAACAGPRAGVVRASHADVGLDEPRVASRGRGPDGTRPPGGRGAAETTRGQRSGWRGRGEGSGVPAGSPHTPGHCRRPASSALLHFPTSVPGARHRPLAPPGVLSSHVTSCQRRVSSHDGARPRSMLLRRTSLSCPAFRARASGRFSGAFPGPGFWWVLASASLLPGHRVAMTTRISDIQAQALAVKTRPGPKMPTSGSGFQGGRQETAGSGRHRAAVFCGGCCRLGAPSGSGFLGGQGGAAGSGRHWAAVFGGGAAGSGRPPPLLPRCLRVQREIYSRII